jgi:uncharacterized glyoxalase superfamily protein PhnB
MPIIPVDSVDQAHDFYIEKLGFSRKLAVLGTDGWLDLAIMQLGPARLMFTRARAIPEGALARNGSPWVRVYVQVADVDLYHQQLISEGVTGSAGPTLQTWGDRAFTIVDPYGCELWFGSPMIVRKPGSLQITECPCH